MTIASKSEPKVWTEKDLEVFNALQTPIWIFDFDFIGKWWANLSGLAVWKVGSNAEMRERGRGSPTSTATKLRVAEIRATLERGEIMRDRWTYYPTGHAPFVADASLSPIYIADAEGAPGRLAMLAEARVIGDSEMDPFYRRGVEVLRHMTEMVSLFKINGELLMRNPAAVHVLGEGSKSPEGTDSFAALFASTADVNSVRASLEKGPVRGTFELVTKDGLAWHALDARNTTDPVTGELTVLVNHRDVSERILAQDALEQSREALEMQAEQLRHLAASPLRVWKGILALPMIGRIDEARIRAGLQGIQARAAREEIKVVLLDLTGAEGVGADAADSIRRLIRSLALQGIGSRVVGVRATLARTLVGEGIDLGTVPLHASLADALATALRK